MSNSKKRVGLVVLLLVIGGLVGYTLGLVYSNGEAPTFDELLGIFNVPWVNTTTGVNAPEFYRNTDNYTAWIESIVGVSDHDALTGLEDDDHPQYLLGDGSESWLNASTGVNVPEFYLSGENKTDILLLTKVVGATAFVGFDKSLAFMENYWYCDSSADNVEVQAALDYVFALGGGLTLMDRGTFIFAANVTVAADCYLQGTGAFGGTRIRVDTDITAIVVSDGPSAVSDIAFNTNIDAGYGEDTPLIQVTAGVVRLENLYFYRAMSYTERGIPIQFFAEVGSGSGIGYCTMNHICIIGSYTIGIHLLNTGEYPTEWINGNHFYDTWVTLDNVENVTGYKLEKTGTGSINRNVFSQAALQQCWVGYNITASCVGNEFLSPACWDMIEGSTNIYDAGTGSVFRDGFINEARTTTLNTNPGEQTQMFDVRGYFGELMESLTFSFVEGDGMVTTPGQPIGWMLDDEYEKCVAFVNLPDYIDHPYMMRVWAIANVTDADNMEINLLMYGAGSNDAWNVDATLVDNKESETTNFASGNYIYWEFNATDDADFDDYVGGDMLQITIRWEAAIGDGCDTNAWFQGGRIYFNRRKP